ncbi:MAG TPA: ChbG/HpnK family deacetylase [Solirubrobacteraceae bacterium]|nr:ChbG/HpnK family deacetylase [Solirubrobacteraceae bacterium]
MRHVIFNADDFGASSGTNRGIVECHTRGVLTSTSMMVTGAAVEEAVELSMTHPQLAVGLHWDVIGEDEREFDLDDHEAVHEEFAAQLQKFHELMGRPPTHIDSHRHMHLEDSVRDLFRELAAPFGVPLRGDGRVRFVGNFYAQWEWGVTDLEHVSVAALQEIIREEVREGWTELSCHPGYATDAYLPMYRHEREAELRTLTDPRIRATLEEVGIELESYATYAARATGSEQA